MNPMMFMEREIYFCPILRMMKADITEMLPLCSSTVPNVVPITMIRPSDFMILPNPSLILFRISATCICTQRPTKKEAAINAKKAGTLKRAVSTTIKTIPASRQRRRYGKECSKLVFVLVV